jgi:hypothetical protein
MYLFCFVFLSSSIETLCTRISSPKDSFMHIWNKRNCIFIKLILYLTATELLSRKPKPVVVSYNRKYEKQIPMFVQVFSKHPYTLPISQYSCSLNNFFKKNWNKQCVLYFDISRFSKKSCLCEYHFYIRCCNGFNS